MYNTKALGLAIEDTFDDVMGGYEKRSEVEEAAVRRDAIFEDFLSRHPEDTDLLKELWDGVLSYTADYVSVAYVEGVKYGVKNGDQIKRFAAEATEPEV